MVSFSASNLGMLKVLEGALLAGLFEAAALGVSAGVGALAGASVFSVS